MNRVSLKLVGGLLLAALSLSGVGCLAQSGNVGNVQSYNFPPVEARWIRDGQPIEFEGELWYPADGIETFLDSEVYYLGDYKGTQFFIEKLDVRPYERLYTKYSKNQFRYFVKREKP